jgi:hypothetical protein
MYRYEMLFLRSQRTVILSFSQYTYLQYPNIYNVYFSALNDSHNMIIISKLVNIVTAIATSREI